MDQIKILKSIDLFALIFFLQGGTVLFAQEISYNGTGNWDRKKLGNSSGSNKSNTGFRRCMGSCALEKGR